MKKIAIITARGGSKRIPKKNIKEFCGKPIIAYSIQAALDSGVFDEVMVSTDSEEIAKIAKEYGANVPFLRSEKTSSDYASTNDVLDEVLECYEKTGEHYDVLCCIYPTAPFLTEKVLKDAMEQLLESTGDSLVPVVKFGFPPQRALVVREEKVAYMYPENMLKRSQDLEPLYHDCGQFYISRVDSYKTKHALVTSNTIPYIMREELVQDIDNMSDWVLAEQKYKAFISEGKEKE